MSGQCAEVIDLQSYRLRKQIEQAPPSAPDAKSVQATAPLIGWMPFFYMPVFVMPMFVLPG